MLATCPNNKKHRIFITVAHEARDWEVDEKGNFLSSGNCIDIVAIPNTSNSWTCKKCGADAIIEE